MAIGIINSLIFQSPLQFFNFKIKNFNKVRGLPSYIFCKKVSCERTHCPKPKLNFPENCGMVGLTICEIFTYTHTHITYFTYLHYLQNYKDTLILWLK